MAEYLGLRTVLARCLDHYAETHTLDAHQWQVCRHVLGCRTEAMGGVDMRCEGCGWETPWYFACRDRHCPRCGRGATEAWCEKQRQSSLPVTYHHLVFTLPHEINPWVQIHPREIYGLLFESVADTSSSMGRLTLNVLLSFAQFEREVTSERIRDKIAASKKKGLWMGGRVPLGYNANDKRLCVNNSEAETVRHIYQRYLALGCVRKLKAELDSAAYVSKTCSGVDPTPSGKPFSRGALYTILKNPLYVGKIRHRDQVHDGQHDAIVEHSVWQAVQRRIERSGNRKAFRTAAKNPSLLAGLIFDDKGNPMSATHSTKSNRRCRYYISQAMLQFRETEAGSVQRIAAESLEATIIRKLMDLLRTGNELLSAVGPCKVSGLRKQQLVSQAKTLAGQWDRLTPHEQITHLKHFVRRVIVGRTELRVTLSRWALVALLLEDVPFTDEKAHADDTYNITIPVNLKRCGIEMKLIVPNGEQPKAHPITIGALQEAVRKALLWNQALVTGEVASMRELATQEHVTPSYIGTLIKLAFLAPDIIEAIAHGEVPIELSLDRLKKGFPLDWEAQRKTLGFSG